MNNKEYLIQILLKLRSIGIKNEKILKSIEKMPPHFYYSLLNCSEDKQKVNIDEVLEIAKLLQLSLDINNKNENVLLFGFKFGWLLMLLTNFSKRVYGICQSISHKKRLEVFFLKNNFKNIYLCYGDNVLSWKKVAPFDLILIFNCNNFLKRDIINQLSKGGQAFLPDIKENNKFNMISINKGNHKLDQNCNFNLLRKSDLI